MTEQTAAQEQKNPKQIRRELWDYLAEQGINITPTQHEHIKGILEQYVIVASGIRKDTYNSAIGELEVARKGFSEWLKVRNERRREKSRRKRERRAQRAQEAQPERSFLKPISDL